MKRWPATWSAIAKRIASSFSVLVIALSVFGADYRAWKASLDAAQTLQAKKQLIREFSRQSDADEDLQNEMEMVVSAWDRGASWSPDRVIRMIEVRASAANIQVGAPTDRLKGEAREIKSNPLYRDLGVDESSNWLARALSRLGELIEKLFRQQEPNTPNMPRPTEEGISTAMMVVKMLIYILLAAVLVLFLYLAIRHFRWRATLKRKTMAILEEDEPERSIDEWLENADKLAAEGKYREAVRSLYLACLLKLDEANVARFIRSQTNWEHLARIEASPRKPSSLEFRDATRQFDRVWYGFRVNGMADVEAFRKRYVDLCHELSAVAA